MEPRKPVQSSTLADAPKAVPRELPSISRLPISPAPPLPDIPGLNVVPMPTTDQDYRCVEDLYEDFVFINSGTYGEVFRARSKANPNQIVAIKSFTLSDESYGFPPYDLREIKYLKLLSGCENVVRLFDVRPSRACVSGPRGRVNLVFEYADYDLEAIRACTCEFAKANFKSIFQQLMNGICYLHNSRIIHRDIKTANLLLTRDGTLKIADFGLARRLDQSMTPQLVTLWYRSPELLFGAFHYTEAVDVWACGCVMAELFYKPLFSGATEKEVTFKIFDLLGFPNKEDFLPETHRAIDDMKAAYLAEKKCEPVPKLERFLERKANIPRDAVKLLMKMLCYNPKSRITASEALKDDYFLFNEPKPNKKFPLPKLLEHRARKRRHEPQAQAERAPLPKLPRFAVCSSYDGTAPVPFLPPLPQALHNHSSQHHQQKSNQQQHISQQSVDKDAQAAKPPSLVDRYQPEQQRQLRLQQLSEECTLDLKKQMKK